MYRILVTNDDGINSKGLSKLVEALQEIATVYVVAPKSQQSAMSRSVTARDTVEAVEVELEGAEVAYEISGTPTDCVIWAMCNFGAIFDFDYVISGINAGENTGANIYYSGTVAGALEGAAAGIHSLALSVDTHEASEFDYICKMIPELLEMSAKLSPEIVLNVNAPNITSWEVKGVKTAKLAPRGRCTDYRFEEQEAGKYQIKATHSEIEEDLSEDYSAMKAGYATITPICADMYNQTVMDELMGTVVKGELCVFIGVQEDGFARLPKTKKLERNILSWAAAVDRLDRPALIADNLAYGRPMLSLGALLTSAERVQSFDYNLLKSEAFEKLINEVKSERVYLAGIQTHIGVEQTAKALLKRGYKVSIVADCCGSDCKENHNLAIDNLRSLGCEITSMEAAAMELAGAGNKPIYREIERIFAEK